MQVAETVPRDSRTLLSCNSVENPRVRLAMAEMNPAEIAVVWQELPGSKCIEVRDDLMSITHETGEP